MALDLPDLRLLRLFMTIVEAGGFAAAQGELGLSLSTISAHVTRLEGRLGVRLCRRGRGGFALTDEGRVVYDEARRLIGQIEQFEGRVRGLKGSLSGTLSIGLVDNTITDPNAPLERLFAAFAHAAPQVMPTLVTRPPNELLRDVVSGQLQVAIGSFPKIALGLAYMDLYEETQRFYCAASHPLFTVPDGEIDVERVRRHAIIGRTYWGQRDLKIFAIGGPSAVVSDMEAEARLILSGAYLGYLPEHFARRYVAEGRLRALRSDLFAYGALFQVAYQPERARHPVLRTLLSIIPEVFGPSERSGIRRGS
jgi:LysR family transcriptional regulator, transcriptional activator for bauABCD operon